MYSQFISHFPFYSWLSYDWQDNSGVLSWLVEILSAAESVGDKVHIISHIPPGNHDCLGAWGRNYAHIIERQVVLDKLVKMHWWESKCLPGNQVVSN